MAESRSRCPYFRRPRTTHEKRWSYAHKELVRAKRRGHKLVSWWDDIRYVVQRSWKTKGKKKRQYKCVE